MNEGPEIRLGYDTALAPMVPATGEVRVCPCLPTTTGFPHSFEFIAPAAGRTGGSRWKFRSSVGCMDRGARRYAFKDDC